MTRFEFNFVSSIEFQMKKHANVHHSGRSLIWVLCHRHNSLWSRKPLGSRVPECPWHASTHYLPPRQRSLYWGSKWELRQCPRSSRNSCWMLYAQVENPRKAGQTLTYHDHQWPLISRFVTQTVSKSAWSKDRKVLRFKGYWDDHTKYGARLYFNIHYYLADNTMEFNEVWDCGFPLGCTVGATWSLVTSNKTWKAPIDLSGISRCDKMWGYPKVKV